MICIKCGKYDIGGGAMVKVPICSQCYDEIEAELAKMTPDDKNYSRYYSLICWPLTLSCRICETAVNVAPKNSDRYCRAWELSCSHCFRSILDSYNPYDGSFSPVFGHLCQIHTLFLHMDLEDGGLALILDVLGPMDHKFSKCSCGGDYSFIAKPRCTSCNSVILNSCFHYVEVSDEDPLS